MTKKTGTVQAAFVHTLFAEAQALGLDARRLVARSGFDPETADNPDARFAHTVYLQLWQAIGEQIADPAFALKLGELVDPRKMGILGSVIMSSKTLRDVGNQFTRYAALLNSLYRVTQAEDGGRYTYTYTPDCPAAFEPGFVESHLAGALTVCRQLSGVDIVPVEMRFHFPEPEHLDAYRRVFRAPLRFSAPDNAMVLDARDLERPLVQHNQYAHDLLCRHAATLLSELQRADSVVGKVQRYILGSMSSGNASIDQCAAALATSRRTLHRQLREEATSFQELHETLRRELAFDYLAQPSVAVSEVAFMLGYSETSAFHRAFRRWSGMTPAAFRKASHKACGERMIAASKPSDSAH